jgi:hypothetical protein
MSVAVVNRLTRDCRTLPALAAEITDAHAAVLRATCSALEHGRRAGDLLIAGKALQPHGAWLPWLAARCPTLPERTARAYMQLARGWSTIEAANRQRVADLPLRDALKLLTEPRPDADSPTSDEFQLLPDYIETEYRCPRCSFGWRGNPKPPCGALDDRDEDER